MIALSVGLDERSYPIIIDNNLLEKVANELMTYPSIKKFAIITDSNIARLYGNTLLESLLAAGLKATMFPFPAGEKNKTIQTISALSSRLVQCGFDRHDGLIALGGGVTGDITGFLAAIYMRGIPFWQIPTSLLAQVDSSVGGKTGVDLPEGKNLIGVFYQPKSVFIDYATLTTLSQDEYLSGLAEVLKYGIIYDAEFFKFLDENRRKIIHKEFDVVEKMIGRCCQIKAEIVAGDEREGNIRRILNFGHTIGHAIESASEFKLSHGFSVSIGMYAAARLSHIKKMISLEDLQDIYNTLSAYGLPTEVPAYLNRGKIKTYLKNDKKVQDGRVHFVLLDGIGKFHITDEVTDTMIDTVLGNN